MPRRTLFINHGSTTTSHICFETCTGCGSLNAFSFDWPYKFTVVDITWRLCISPMICTGLMSRKHSSDCDLAPVKGLSYREPDYAPSATGHSELQPRACGTVFRPLSLLPAHSRLSKDNWKLFFLRTHSLSFSFILIVYRVLEAFSLNATLIFTLRIIIIIIILQLLLLLLLLRCVVAESRSR